MPFHCIEANSRFVQDFCDWWYILVAFLNVVHTDITISLLTTDYCSKTNFNDLVFNENQFGLFSKDIDFSETSMHGTLL